MEDQLLKHFEDDKKNFGRIDKILEKQDSDHKEFSKDLKEIKAFMENLSGVNDFVKGASLLKKPMIWFLSIVVGIVALMGGLKSIIGWFVLSK